MAAMGQIHPKESKNGGFTLFLLVFLSKEKFWNRNLLFLAVFQKKEVKEGVLLGLVLKSAWQFQFVEVRQSPPVLLLQKLVRKLDRIFTLFLGGLFESALLQISIEI